MMDSTDPNDNGTGAATADLTGLDHVKEKSLKSAGVAYLVGDAGLFASGIMSKRYKEASSAVFYSLGGAFLARYGNPKAEKRLHILYQDLGKYLKAQGVEIPKGSDVDTAMLAKDNGLIHYIERFLYLHPSQAFNALNTCAGVQLFRSGVQHSKHWDTLAGAMVTAGALSGILIPERHPTKDDPPPKTIPQKLWRWAQEKPLRVTGYFFMANNAFLVASAVKEYRTNPAQKSYYFKFLSVASYMVANGLLALSLRQNVSSNKQNETNTSGPQKKKSDEEDDVMQSLERAAAQVIAAQPVPVQQALIHQVAGYLSAKGDISIPPSEMAQAMEEQLKRYTVPAEAIKDSWKQRLAADPSLGASPTATPSL